ncbi:hypothetical protein BABINDRAFT_168064 [Babjeviella inositovora NRRL Y-12698]|uniref:Autophagy-related protein 18 n=1 Tax=Babjeviella inositovora NRRL Y-12698 TaxID=984486 RepID=A0A1E3QP89_9ASCO|nr:uncharacterized protein BABINDRAFT_168064 [Babjeviella inositovora NRRL Y-12698]ODQ78892.1 hypothetical protein BABINDRAFT_168064 [Babjeviella inositovora NRRL Y-12698]
MLMKSVSFNQDNSCLAVGTSHNNFKIYNCDPFGECYSLKNTDNANADFNEILTSGPVGDTGGITNIEMLYSTSLVALTDQATQLKRLIIFNFATKKVICTLKFTHEIATIKLNRHRMVVWLKSSQIYIYDISRMKLLKVLDYTVPRESEPRPGKPQGQESDEALGDLATNSYLYVPYLLGETRGKVRSIITVYDTINLKTVTTLENPHKSPVASLTVAQSGEWMATASNKGTIIRVFQIAHAEETTITKVFDFRRGRRGNRIQCMAFGFKDFAHGTERGRSAKKGPLITGDGAIRENMLLVSSESNTIHVFRLDTKADRRGNSISSVNSDRRRSVSDAETYGASDYESDGDAVSQSESVASLHKVLDLSYRSKSKSPSPVTQDVPVPEAVEPVTRGFLSGTISSLWSSTKSNLSNYTSHYQTTASTTSHLFNPIYNQLNDWYEPTRDYAVIHLPSQDHLNSLPSHMVESQDHDSVNSEDSGAKDTQTRNPKRSRKVLGVDRHTGELMICCSDGWFYVYDLQVREATMEGEKGATGGVCRLRKSYYVL